MILSILQLTMEYCRNELRGTTANAPKTRSKVTYPIVAEERPFLVKKRSQTDPQEPTSAKERLNAKLWLAQAKRRCRTLKPDELMRSWNRAWKKASKQHMEIQHVPNPMPIKSSSPKIGCKKLIIFLCTLVFTCIIMIRHFGPEFSSDNAGDGPIHTRNRNRTISTVFKAIPSPTTPLTRQQQPPTRRARQLSAVLREDSVYVTRPTKSASQTTTHLQQTKRVESIQPRGQPSTCAPRLSPSQPSTQLSRTPIRQPMEPEQQPQTGREVSVRNPTESEDSESTQAELFEDQPFESTPGDFIGMTDPPTSSTIKFTLYFDGGAEHSTPYAGYMGAALYYHNMLVWKGGDYLGKHKTNNIAEYEGLMFGVKKTIELGIKC